MANITIEKTAEDLASKSLRITVPVDRVQAAESKALNLYQKRARLPGFRPGKAPVAVVRKRFGDAIRQAVLEELLQESWQEVKEQESLQPIADPSVRNLKFEEGSPLEFDLLVEVRPEITLERTGGFTVRRTVQPVTDEAVQEQLHKLQEQKAAWLPVEGEKPAAGQLARVEVAPLADDGTVGEAQTYDVVLGEGQAAPELEERIMTLRPGETTDAEIRFPDDHPDPERRGRVRRVRVTLHEVKRQELPPLDDAFAREVGDFEGLDALRAAVRTDLEAEAGRTADAAVREQLVEQLVEANGVSAPPSLVERFLHAYSHAYQVPQEQYAAFTEQFRPIAEAQVKRDLVLDAVVRQQSLKATEEEIDARVAEIAAARNVPAGQVYASFQKANRLGELERALTEEKAFAWLREQSTVQEQSN